MQHKTNKNIVAILPSSRINIHGFFSKARALRRKKKKKKKRITNICNSYE